MMDGVTQLAHLAFRRARRARDLLDNEVLPNLPPDRRAGASRLRRRLEQGPLLEEAALNDIQALVRVLEQAVAAGTSVEWTMDEHHAGGDGYKTTEVTPEAQTLAHCRVELSGLAEAVADVLDARQAVDAVNRLFSD